MLKETNLDNVKERTKVLLYAAPIEPIDNLPVVSHPFTDSTLTIIPNETGPSYINLLDKENLEKWYKFISEQIDSAESLNKIYLRILSAYKLTFLKFVKDDLSNTDFSRLLADAWTHEENPNMDANVNIRTAISWFKQANKTELMTPEDYEIYCNLPDEFEVYRGVSIGRTPKGLSWTRNRDKAEWFMHRFENRQEGAYGSLLRATINKQNALAYFNTRDEDEIVVDYYQIQSNIQTVSI